MSYRSLLAVSQRLNSSMEALAAISAELSLRTTGTPADPRVRTLLQEIVEKVEPGLLEGLTTDEEVLALATINVFFRHALDLIDDPGRAPGWSIKDADILQTQGKMSRRMVQTIDELAPQSPEFNETLRQPGTFLDVGTGVGWLAIEAARTWPTLRVVGIDPWEPSLSLARQNLATTGMADQVELRAQRLEDIPEQEAFTLIWLPGAFLPYEIIPSALEKMRDALKPGGWLVFGFFAPPPDPLGESLTTLKVVRFGGHPWNIDEVESRMRDAGFEQIKSFTPPHFSRFTIGKRSD